MSSEKNDFLTMIEKTIDYDLNVGDFNNIQTYWNLPGFLLKQGNNYYNLIVSNKYSIQTVFSDASLRAYFSNEEGSNINSLNECYVNVRKYHFDYIIKGSVYNRDLAVNYVIYVEDFELENKKEENVDVNKYQEVINLQNFAEKIPAILNLHNKIKLRNTFSDDFIPTFSAKNFIQKTFIHYPLEESNTFIDGTLNKNKFYLNYLMKKNIGVQGQINAFDDEAEEKITKEQNAYDYKPFYEVLPSIQDKMGNKFVALPSSLEFTKIHTEKTKEEVFKPYELKFDLNEIQLTKEKFLQKKVRRGPNVSESEKLPQDILEIIKEYSDVCANICYDNVEKHKIFRKLKDYIK